MKVQRKNNINVLLCSKNPAKIAATEKICSNIFASFNLACYETPSGINETPDTDDEAILGCYSRISLLESQCFKSLDYIVALEGLVEKKSFGCFVYGWAVVKDILREEFFYGCSGKVMLPNSIYEKIDNNNKLSDVMKQLYIDYSQKELDHLGTNGILTAGMYTRIDEFETALKCAFGRARNPEIENRGN